MIVIPAVDILAGQAVRLLHGDYDRITDTRGDPLALAREWTAAGARLIHVVDLDGARAGWPVNSATIKNLCRGVDVPVEVSGGLRGGEAVAAMLRDGAARVVLGTVALKDHALLRTLVEQWGPERIVVGIDARDGLVATEGWREDSRTAATDLAREVVALGVRALIYTDIGRDGTLAGPNLAALRAMIDAVQSLPPQPSPPQPSPPQPSPPTPLPASLYGLAPDRPRPVPVQPAPGEGGEGRTLPVGSGERGVAVIASGGVGTLDHLRQLRDAGAAGAIVGRALYNGAIDLATAIRVIQEGREGELEQSC